MRLIIVACLAILFVTMFEAYYWYTSNFATKTIPRMELRQIEGDKVAGELIAQTTSGPVAGARRSSGVIRFSSIPYGRPPVGELRYAAPMPADNWDGLLDASHLGPRCMQHDTAILGNWGGGQSEDCLWLSVTTPAVDRARRPVIVWIHGGGFHAGGAAETTYDGSFIAARGDVVVVNIQYRLGTYGWLDVSHLGGEDVAGSAANGQLDQLLALEWVRDNIEDFGGDPDNVTLMGESAGSYAVASLLQLPAAEALFRQSILISGVFTPGVKDFTKKDISARFMSYAGLESLADLRAAPTKELQKAQNKLGEYALESGFPDLQPFVEVAPPAAADFQRAGLSNKPILHGTTQQEYHFFTLMVEDTPGKERRLALDLFAGLGVSEVQVEKLVGLIRAERPGREDKDLYLDALSGAFMFYPHKILSDTYGGTGAPVYVYLFDWGSTAFPELGAFHGLDLLYFFGTLEMEGADSFVGENAPETLSEEMIDTIASFARTGQPRVPGLADWPAYSDQRRMVMKLGVPSQLVEDPMSWLDEFEAEFQGMIEAAR